MVELRFARKVNPQYSAFQLVNKKIKDGSRDKRQYLKSKIQVVKQQAPDTDVQGAFLLPGINSIAFQHCVEMHEGGAYLKQQPAFARSLPLYLQHHRMQV